MAFAPGDNYVGYFAEDYDALVTAASSYSELSQALSGWFTAVQDGAYYIFTPTGDATEFDFLLLLQDAGLDETAEFQYFSYLQSTWSVNGWD